MLHTKKCSRFVFPSSGGVWLLRGVAADLSQCTAAVALRSVVGADGARMGRARAQHVQNLETQVFENTYHDYTCWKARIEQNIIIKFLSQLNESQSG